MEIGIREKQDIAIVDIKGKLTLDSANAQFREAIDSLLAMNKKKILVNLSEMDYIDSTGVGELVSSLKTVENLGGKMKLVTLDNRVYSTLSLALLLPVFDVSRDEEEALAKFLN